jgi:hypothetical protein
MAPPPKSPHLYLVEDRGFETPCWIWQRASNSGGYAVMRTGEGSKRLALAHGVFWERENGPVPAGHELDHLCGVTLCVRPSHVEPVTHAENTRRGRSAKLVLEQVVEIKRRLAAGEQPSSIAPDFGVVPDHVRSIRRGVRWAEA